MPTDNAIRDHQTWLNYLQPDGLVVSPAALVDAQVYLDRDINDRQEAFLGFVRDAQMSDGFATSAVGDLQAFLTEFLEWPQDFIYGLDAARPLPDALIIHLPELNETLSPTLALRAGSDDMAPWILLVKEISTGADMDARDTENPSWSASAAQRFERLLRESKVPIGLLTNGTNFRLVYAPSGENPGSVTFPVQAMTEVAGRSILAAFWMLLRKYRLLSAPSDATLSALLIRSREYQSTVSTKLASQVLDALYELLRGFQSADAATRGALLRKLLASEPDEIYHGLLTVLLRLIFLLFAEDRGLLPTSEVYAQNYSIHGLFARLRSDAQRYPDTMNYRFGAWAQLVALFRAVFAGSSHKLLRMPARKGYLFDPNRYPFLEGRSDGDDRLPLISDGVVFRVLENLVMLDGERLSYRTLDVEQIGSVYETMMGFRLELTRGRTIALRAAKANGAPTAINLDDLLATKSGARSKWLAAATDNKLSGKNAEALEEANTIDDALAALDRRIARNATPDILPTGVMILQPTDERRKSGSHYTPRALTEPIVRTTLRPILERLGENPTPAQILDLKVCDIAVGSGAFLVEGCRQLGDVLLRAWHAQSELPIIPPDEDEVLHARRVVAQRCLYGVDKNPMAVDLTKLSLWLATLAKDHPFTFIDHAVRSGDSLVGLTIRQLADFQWQHEREQKRVFGQEFIEMRIATATTARRIILAAADDYTSPDLKTHKLQLADDALNPVRQAGDMVVAAFFNAETKKDRARLRDEYLAQYTRFGREFDPALDPEPIVRALRRGDRGLRPFHWEIEFPEVFSRDKPGFDAIVGNPPFLGGKRISTLHGDAMRDWLSVIHDEASSNADLVAHFFRRAFKLLREAGTLGLIATNTISQGDTRAGGLRWICTNGGTIYAATKRMRWPGQAAVIVSVVHIGKGSLQPPFRLDGRDVEEITAFLFHSGPNEDPFRLRANEALSYSGSFVNGVGFLFDDANVNATPISEMQRLIVKDERNSQRVFPYIGGEEVNDAPDQTPRRFVINFGDMTEAEARRWPDLMAIVERKVQPARASVRRDAHRERWWQYGDKRPELYNTIRKLDRVLVNSQVGQHVAFAFLPVGWVYAHTLNIFTLRSYAAFCVLQSRVHETWARFLGSSMKDDLRYTPSDCFETFPFVDEWQTHPVCEEAGKAYYEFRAALMIGNDEGLTTTYNRFHDPDERGVGILQLRDLHDEMDRAVLAVHGWTDIQPTCEFILDYGDEESGESSSRGKKPWRYRWPDRIRDEMLARLLKLNKERAEAERLIAAPEKSARRNSSGQRSAKPKSTKGPGLFES